MCDVLFFFLFFKLNSDRAGFFSATIPSTTHKMHSMKGLYIDATGGWTRY